METVNVSDVEDRKRQKRIVNNSYYYLFVFSFYITCGVLIYTEIIMSLGMWITFGTVLPIILIAMLVIEIYKTRKRDRQIIEGLRKKSKILKEHIKNGGKLMEEDMKWLVNGVGTLSSITLATELHNINEIYDNVVTYALDKSEGIEMVK